MKPETKLTLENALLGKKITIINMQGEPHYAGRSGTVDHIDDKGHIFGTWGGCSLLPGIDEYVVES